MKRVTAIVVGITFAAAGGTHAQTTVYKCSHRSYSETPCSGRIVRTYEAPVDPPRRARDVVAQRLPGESTQHLALRKRRAGLNESDRDECARLDKKIPFEQERMKKDLQQEEIDEAQESLGEARKRFKQLRC